MTLQSFISKKPYLVWSTKDYMSLSDDIIVESILNYGDMNDVREMIEIIGIESASNIFNRLVDKRRCNLKPKIANYFKLYFEKYA